MLEIRLGEVKTEAEALYREMSGGKEVSLKVLPTTMISVAGVLTESKELYVHPDFILSKVEAEQLYPKNRSELCRLLREDEAMFPRARKAILAHEISHLYFGHRSGTWHHHVATYLMFPTGILIIPYLSAISFFFTLIGIRILAVNLLAPIRNLSEKYQEHHADLKALETTKDFKGMVYFLNKGASLVKGFTLSHPHPIDRIRYLKKHYEA